MPLREILREVELAQTNSERPCRASCLGEARILFVVRPHAEHLHGPLATQDLVDQSVLDVDPPRIGAAQVSDQLLEGWRGLQRVRRKQVEQFFHSGTQTRAAIYLASLCAWLV